VASRATSASSGIKRDSPPFGQRENAKIEVKAMIAEEDVGENGAGPMDLLPFPQRGTKLAFTSGDGSRAATAPGKPGPLDDAEFGPRAMTAPSSRRARRGQDSSGKLGATSALPSGSGEKFAQRAAPDAVRDQEIARREAMRVYDQARQEAAREATDSLLETLFTKKKRPIDAPQEDADKARKGPEKEATDEPVANARMAKQTPTTSSLPGLPGIPQSKSRKPNAFKDYVRVEDTANLKREYLYNNNEYVRNKISEMKTSASHQRISEARMTAEDMDDLLRFKGDNYSLTVAQWERANPAVDDPFWTTAFNCPVTTSDMRNPMKKVMALNDTMKKIGPQEQARARHQTIKEALKFKF
jgi:hypothetical protein